MARTSGKEQQHRGTQSKHEEERGHSNQQQRTTSGGQQTRGSQSGGQQQSQSQQTGLAQRSQGMMPGLMSPFSFMRRFSEGMEQLFNDFGSGALMPHGMGELSDWRPQIEVFQREGELCIRADLPGMNKDDVHVEVLDDAIVLQGERREEHREEREGLYSTEVTYGRFYREVPLPEGVDADKANATFRDGVLEISMPMERGETRGRQLEIQESRSGEQQQGRQQQARAAGAGR